jgi:chromosome segregation protein
MYLDQLQLLGFKSFPEKTILKFSPGISCIVGPNGCGKTNILDALRWVLGETRMSILRGGKLEEVIFSGTREIKPLGMAEVNLTIQNDDGVLSTPYNQITITRRLYRSGDSEFFINKTPCRRKDITEMFFDTGLTSGTYSVIEQDMVDVILSDRAEDRRHFFEEAAGITKYKQRKKEALRKLESTETDLMRLEDLYSEVFSQANSLKRQVSKAERHKTLQEDIQRIAVELAIDKWLKFQKLDDDLSTKHDNLQSELEKAKAREKVLELDREKIRLNITEEENKVRVKRENLSSLTDRLHDLETQISVLTEKYDNSVNLHTRTTQEISSLKSKHDGLELEIKNSQSESEQYSLKNQELTSQVALGEEKLDQMTSAARDISTRYDEVQAQIKILIRELNENQENQITLDLKYSTSLEKIDEIKLDIGQSEVELRNLQGEKLRLDSSHDELSSQIEKLDKKKASLSEELQNLRDKQHDLTTNLDKLNSEYHQLNAEIELTGKIIHQYEGYTSGAVQLGNTKGQFPGLIDTVANLINPQAEFVACVQTVLGELSNYFVVDTQETAQSILAYGQENKFGRFGLIIFDNIPETNDAEVTFTNNPNILGQLSNFISSKKKYSRLVNYLFKDILVSRNLFEEKGLPGFDMVSPQGEMLDFEKSLAIGGTEEILLVGRRAQFDEQNIRRKEMEDQITSSTLDIEASVKRQNDLEKSINETSDQLTSLRENFASIKTSLTQNELKIQAISTQLDEKKKNSESIASKLQEINSEKSGLGELLDSRRKQLEELEQQSVVFKQELENKSTSKEEFSRELSSLKMQLFTAESSMKTSESNRERLVELKADIDHNLEEKGRLIDDLMSSGTEIKREIRENEEKLQTLFTEKESTSEILLKDEGEITEISSQIAEIDKKLKNLRLRSEDLSEQMHEVGMQSNSLSSQKTTLLSDTHERYNCDLAAQSRIIELSEESRVIEEKQLENYKNTLASLGPVNLLALEEFDQAKSRSDFLKGQIDDLSKAKDDLKLTISRINTTARKKFMETFETVRENFQNVFCELFEGGEANLKLDENVDPLEANVQISARPRGKKMLSIHQLSGGERALTATSLLFSFYMVKPSPYCILDEVDAPLDDANIARFLKLIKRFTENTQFIIITHNKLTMEEAETLYGITMSKPGVSQIVSVDLKKAAGLIQTTHPKPDDEQIIVASRLENTAVTTEADTEEVEVN